MAQKIFLKDAIANKDFNELMKMIPCMVCREYMDYRNQTTWESYEVVGFTPNGIVLGYESVGYDEDAFFGDGRYTYDDYKIVEFEDLGEEYILANKPTEKQQEWLEKNGYSGIRTGYEAWHLIDNAIKESEARKASRALARKRREEEEEEYGYDDFDDNYWDCYDVPNR